MTSHSVPAGTGDELLQEDRLADPTQPVQNLALHGHPDLRLLEGHVVRPEETLPADQLGGCATSAGVYGLRTGSIAAPTETTPCLKIRTTRSVRPEGP